MTKGTIDVNGVLALLVIFAFVPLHWLLFQGQEVVPGVIARSVGPCDVESFERRGGEASCDRRSAPRKTPGSAPGVFVSMI